MKLNGMKSLKGLGDHPVKSPTWQMRELGPKQTQDLLKVTADAKEKLPVKSRSPAPGLVLPPVFMSPLIGLSPLKSIVFL